MLQKASYIFNSYKRPGSSLMSHPIAKFETGKMDLFKFFQKWMFNGSSCDARIGKMMAAIVPSYLVKMSANYPLYNEETELPYSFGDLPDGKLSVKEDILPHLRKPFCCLRTVAGADSKTAEVSLMELPECSPRPL